MNKEILFRGKRIDNGEWIENFSIMQLADGTVNLGSWIINPVVAETVGQFTGQVDNNGIKAFEGDKIKGICTLSDRNGYETDHEVNGIIRYSIDLCAFVFTENIKIPIENYCNFMFQLSNFEIIGNIHDNPELLNL